MKIETLRELQKAATFMSARQFVEEYTDELAALPRAQPYVNAIQAMLTRGKTDMKVSNDQIRGSYAALAVVVRMDLDDALRVSKPVKVAEVKQNIPSHVRIKVLPAQPAVRENETPEERRNFRKAVELIREVEAKLKADAAKKSGKVNPLAAKKVAEKLAKQEKERPAVPRLGSVPSQPFIASDSIEVPAVHMGTRQRAEAVQSFFRDVRYMNGGEHGGAPRDPTLYKISANDTTFNNMKVTNGKPSFTIPSLITKKSRTPEQIIETHASLLASHDATRQYLTLYRRGQINAYNVIEAARRQFTDRLGAPLREKMNVRDWKRNAISGSVTPEKMAAYEAAQRYVASMTALNLTIVDPVTYPLADCLRAESPRLASGKSQVRTGKGRSLAKMLSDAVFGVGADGATGLVGDMNDIDKLVNGSEAGSDSGNAE